MRVGHKKDLFVYVFPVVGRELCQISLDTLVLWAFSRDILHPGSLDNICSREGAYV